MLLASGDRSWEKIVSSSRRTAAGSFRGDMSELIERLGSNSEAAARANRKAEARKASARDCPRTLNQSLFEKAWGRSDA